MQRRWSINQQYLTRTLPLSAHGARGTRYQDHSQPPPVSSSCVASALALGKALPPVEGCFQLRLGFELAHRRRRDDRDKDVRRGDGDKVSATVERDHDVMRKVECDQNDYPDQSTSSPSPCFRGSIKCSTAPARLQAPWSPKPPFRSRSWRHRPRQPGLDAQECLPVLEKVNDAVRPEERRRISLAGYSLRFPCTATRFPAMLY